MSQIPWGTGIVRGPDDTVLYETHSLQTRYRTLKDAYGRPLSASEVEQEYFALFGRAGFPSSWVFNDFGPWSVRYFRDNNGNNRLDPGEKLSGEMIHTTPDNEGEAAQGKAVQLFESHGCIHIKPADRERFHQAGAFAKGNALVISRYDSPAPPAWR
jgi:hypothetical protein